MMHKSINYATRKKSVRRKTAAAVCLLTVISLLFGTVPWHTGLVAHAAVVPTLNITTGTAWKYTVSGKNVDSVSYGTASPETSKMSVTQSGDTITIQETAANKLYELGYVPIVTSTAVPANTTYQTTLTFNAVGDKNGTGSALAVMELYDFGVSNDSAGLAFNMKDDDTFSSSSYTKMRNRTKDEALSGSYTVTVQYANTSSYEKTIYHYFGYFVGVHYGSKKNHQMKATCTVSHSGIVGGDEIVPAINVQSSDARYNICSNPYMMDSFSQENFLTDREEITKEDLITMGFISKNENPLTISQILATAKKSWSYRLLLSVNGNELTFAPKGETTVTGIGRLSYIPFTVPLTVPAYATRTCYLSFEINYERNTGSNEAFFAELIAGDVPDTFNAAKSSALKGNTKLRVYSTGGDAHSGSITIPVTLTNDTGRTKTFREKYVFFAGSRPPGILRTPYPDFHLVLKDIRYEDEEYDVTVNAENCTYMAPAKATTGKSLQASFTPNAHYTLPGVVAVKIGDTMLPAANYSWNGSTGALTIPAKYITGPVTVTAKGVPDSYNITYTGLEGASLDVKPSKHTYGTATRVGNPTKTGYTFTGWVVNAAGSVQKNLMLGATAYTGNISLKAIWAKVKYNVTLSGANVSPVSGFGTEAAAYTTAWTGTIQADDGYVLPGSISVTVGGKTLDSSQYTYTKSTGTVKIAAAYVTGNIVVTAGGHKHSYTGVITIQPTCTAKGVMTYTCACGEKYTQEISAKGHRYGEPAWNWTGVSSAKATFTCQSDNSHIQTVNAAITSRVTEEATCTDDGMRVYTASVRFNNQTYTDAKPTVIPTAGHNWAGEWSSDSERHWHICTNEGCNATDTKTAHSFTWVIDREPTVNTAGLKHEECTVCNYAKEAEEYTVDIVSVEISWGAMEFTYSEGTWNAETHTYDGSGWIPDETDSNAISITNKGNVEVSVSYGYTQTNAAVTGSFTDGANPITAPVALPVGDKKRAWLIVKGKPSESLDRAVLGMVTVTIGGE